MIIFKNAEIKNMQDMGRNNNSPGVILELKPSVIKRLFLANRQDLLREERWLYDGLHSGRKIVAYGVRPSYNGCYEVRIDPPPSPALEDFLPRWVDYGKYFQAAKRDENGLLRAFNKISL